MPRPFEKQLEPFQRDAAARAKADYGLAAPDVAARAAEGRLKSPDGELLEPFTITAEYVRKLSSDLVRGRQGKNASPLSKLPPRDAVEALRVRLVNLADHELAFIEKQRTGKRDLTRMRDVIRCVKEAASIALPKEQQARPGEKVGGQAVAGERTRGGATGSLLAAMRGTKNDESPHEAGSENGSEAT